MKPVPANKIFQRLCLEHQGSRFVLPTGKFIPYTLLMALSVEEKEYLKRVGLRLRELRENKGWTLEETEEHGWVSWRHLQRIESGKNVTLLSLRKIALLYKCRLGDILD